jgi:hypothetical protein
MPFLPSISLNIAAVGVRCVEYMLFKVMDILHKDTNLQLCCKNIFIINKINYYFVNMKKYFILIIISFSLLSCKKELAKITGKTCWQCEVYHLNGTTEKKPLICNKADSPSFKDANGNDLPSSCVQK